MFNFITNYIKKHSSVRWDANLDRYETRQGRTISIYNVRFEILYKETIIKSFIIHNLTFPDFYENLSDNIKDNYITNED